MKHVEQGAIFDADSARIERVGRKLIYSACLAEFGLTFPFRNVQSTSIFFCDRNKVAELPGAQPEWHPIQPESIAYAVAYRQALIDCTVAIRDVLWVFAEVPYLP